jgi:formate dehydrogenase subunit beta
MMMDAVKIDVKDGDFNAALTGALGAILDAGVVDALLVPQESAHGTSINQTLVKSRAGLKRARPVNFVMPVNSAKILVLLSETEPREKVAAVLRPCELRAAVELVKLNQINRDSMLLIGLDCPGTFKMKVYDKKAQEIIKAGRDPTMDIAQQCQTMLRDACWACEHFWPIEGTADLVVAHLGSDMTRELYIEAQTDRGHKALGALEKAGYAKASIPDARKAEISRRSAQNAEFRGKWAQDAKKRLGTMDGILSALSNCIRCYNCRDACPICYCKECIFDAEFMKPSPDGMLRKAGRKGILKMPQDTLLFHITRLNHMVSSCVRCGMCEEACPNDIPVAQLFCSEAGEVQRIFDYVAGQDPKAPLPLATFKEKELEEIDK